MTKFETCIAPVETGLSQADHDEALSVFEDFALLPENVKNQLVFDGEPGRERNTKAGYARRSFVDKKQIFHFTEKLQEQMDQSHLNMPQEARNFMKIAREFYEIALDGLDKIIDQHNVYIRPIHFPPSRINNHHLRFLLYDDADDGDVIAAPHYDQSTLTVAICESEPGLRIGNGPEDISSYQRNNHQSILFPGYGWLNLHRQLGISTNYLPAWHDVIKTPSETKTTGVGRMAIILFANPAFIDASPDNQRTSSPLNSISIDALIAEGVLA